MVIFITFFLELSIGAVLVESFHYFDNLALQQFFFCEIQCEVE